MSLQFLVDGLISGAMIGMGAIGITLTCSILRFSNFAQGDLMAWGAYAALVVTGITGTHALAPFSFGLPMVAAVVVAMGVASALALGLDWVLFARLRARGQAIIAVMASFGASMALRNLLEFGFTSSPAYFSNALQIARPLGAGIRMTPDQGAALVMTAALVGALHLFLTRSQSGREMRAYAQNPALARVTGIDVARVIRLTWVIGASLAAAAGVMVGTLVQIRPLMGLDLLLPIFAAAILGGIGSVPGAVLAGLIIGLSEAAAVLFIGAEWRAGVSFVILIAVLLIRPTGLFGGQER